jgi:hypothetical protein
MHCRMLPLGRIWAHGRRRYFLSALVLLGLADVLTSSRAQSPGCTVITYTDPPREELQCMDGLTLSAERGTSYRLISTGKGGRPSGAVLDARGLLIEASPQRGKRFQIQTPHAIASMRGTIWAVDVGPSRTSVFVRQGIVDVRRLASASDAVRLGPGDGVDVEPASGQPLRATRWSAERAAHLLARFGR